MRLQLLKSILIYALNLLSTAYGSPLGLWQTRNSPMIIIQSPLQIGFELRPHVSIPNISDFLGRLETNHLDETTKRLNEYQNNVIKNKEVKEDHVYFVKNNDKDNFPKDETRNVIKTYFTPNDIVKIDSRTKEITTPSSTETTTELTTESFSTENFETTTDEEIYNRSGLSPSIVASLLG